MAATSIDLADFDPLAPEPAMLTEIRIGYARVSAGGQNLERQIDALTNAGCRRIFAEKKSGKNAERPELVAALEFMRSGDTLVVPSLDRLSRSLQELITTVGDLRRRGVGFTSLHEHLDTTTPGGRLVFHVFAALAEFIRELIIAGTHEGLAAARARGRVGGRPSVVTPDLIRAARDLLPNPEHSITSIAKLLGVSPGTLSNHIPTSGSCAPQASRHDPERRGRRGAPDRLPAPGCLMWLPMTFVAAVPAGPRQRLPEERQASVCPALPAGHPAGRFRICSSCRRVK